MVCIVCSGNTQVINSRLQKRANAVWRRRKCLNCHATFTTHEKADYSALWRVTSNNLALSPFSRDKLFVSLYKSLQHRATALDDAAGLTDTVIANLIPVSRDGLLQNKDIADQAITVLELFDSVASTHYRAFHK